MHVFKTGPLSHLWPDVADKVKASLLSGPVPKYIPLSILILQSFVPFNLFILLFKYNLDIVISIRMMKFPEHCFVKPSHFFWKIRDKIEAEEQVEEIGYKMFAKWDKK